MRQGGGECVSVVARGEREGRCERERESPSTTNDA